MSEGSAKSREEGATPEDATIQGEDACTIGNPSERRGVFHSHSSP